MFWVIGVYIFIGLISTTICFHKEPLLLYARWGLILLIPLMVIAFPYWFWVIVLSPDETGRWI